MMSVQEFQQATRGASTVDRCRALLGIVITVMLGRLETSLLSQNPDEPVKCPTNPTSKLSTKDANAASPR